MPPKTRAPYQTFEYLEAGTDYREFTLAKELERVPPSSYPLDADQTKRLDRILATAPLVSSHDHCVVMPEDIEETVQDCHTALRRHCGAAFSVPDHNDEEQLVLVQEVERTFRRQIAVEEIIAAIREAISREHEIAAREIVLIRTGSLPKTSSGKIQRRLTRQMFLAGTLSLV